jgi:hypothetical protein
LIDICGSLITLTGLGGVDICLIIKLSNNLK